MMPRGVRGTVALSLLSPESARAGRRSSVTPHTLLTLTLSHHTHTSYMQKPQPSQPPDNHGKATAQRRHRVAGSGFGFRFSAFRLLQKALQAQARFRFFHFILK